MYFCHTLIKSRRLFPACSAEVYPFPMFERYTERARRVIFFGRYEASQFGDTEIDDAHLLLGLLREDKALFYRFLSHREAETSRANEDATVNDLRKKVEEQIGPPRLPKVSTSVDLPLSAAGKRILAYAAEEAEKLNHQHIDSQHLFLGILREQTCLAASILANEGITLAAAREMIAGALAVEEQPTTAAGVGWGRGAGFAGTRAPRPTTLEFHCEGKIIASAAVPAASPIPRVGESVTIRGKETQELSYRVEDVSYVYESYGSEATPAPHQLKKVLVRLQR